MSTALSQLALVLSAALGASANDRLEVLYTKRLLFDRSGQPLVTVRLQEGQRSLWIEAPGALEWRLRGGPREALVTPPGRRWHVTLEGVTRGTRRWWPVIERFSAADPQRTAAALARWRGKGYEVRAFERGVTLGLGDLHIDTRIVAMGVAPADSRRAARRAGRRLPQSTGRVHEEWVERPSGWVVARSDDGLEIRARDLLSVRAQGGQALTIGGVRWRKQRARTRSFGGLVDLLIGEDGRLMALETAPAEQILEGTVPSEMFPRAPAEALKAQAVAARGQLVARLGTRHPGQPYHVCSSTHCQVYSGRTHLSAPATEAVRATRGVLLVDDGGLTESVYGSACGGHTEAFHLMWGGHRDRVLTGRPDGAGISSPRTEAAVRRFMTHPPKAWCGPSGRRSGVFRWRARRPGQAVTARIARRADIGEVTGIKVLRRGRSGRALTVAYQGTQGEHVVRGEHLNRKLLGGLRSGLWVVDREGGHPSGQPEAWVFQGGGFGHGVGLCQHGAVGQARAGWAYPKILRHYYPGARLERFW